MGPAQVALPLSPRRRPAAVAALLLAFALVVALRPAPAAAVPFRPPILHLSWKAAPSDSGATTTWKSACTDSTEDDTLFLTFESPPNNTPVTGMSATLLFEPQIGDTLGSYWWMERGGPSAGNLLIDFDLLSSESCSGPFRTFVTGHVGYAHTAGRGRLDLSADVTPQQAATLFPNACYFLARVTLRHRRSGVQGCTRPLKITWAGARFRSPVSGEMSMGTMPLRSIAWNAPRGGVAVRRTRLAIETWVPHYAPPSRSAMVSIPQAGTPPEVGE